MRTDLHIHTTASDSCWTPEQVVAGVQEEGIDLFAVADHDSIASVTAAEALAREAGLAFLRAVEISTMKDGDLLLHVLGYGIDLEDEALRTLIRENRAKLEATDDEDVRQFIALGYPLDFNEYLAYDYDRARGGWKSLNYLIDKGLCTGLGDFFKNFRSKIAHPWPDFVLPEEAISAIRGAGGVPILAHPGASFRKSNGLIEEHLDAVFDLGIAGVECYSQYHDEETTATCVAWCRRHGLIVTGGSDYHGGFVGRKLGVPVVDSADLQLGELEEHIVR